MVKVGVIGLQGDVEEHIWAARRALENLGVSGDVIWLKKPEQLENISAIIIPGGESTTISRLMVKNGLFEPVKKLGEEGLPIMGTCAGLIMLSKEVIGATPEQKFLELLDVKVNRNAYGRQVDSFEAPIKLAFSGEPFPGVFIRAPRIVELLSERVKPIAWLGDRVVGVEQDNIIGLEFHPELTDDTRVHEYFLRKAV
ncbi:pyridoxine biosynthesis amidotransferase, SNO family [Thermococcus kodakarensis KOD1]|uniref:Pyridoxal 5'-phosphate synthase subunit PdxT n=1 Tax=Thermococcus kodakarensis (strain ATCC BAA-918 / JCM 12380 / KOD1) TaxID=69014 RepID=PDXT_THEKO|nr:pyridoxal 5'-phosphate synthase glutaminase subunit PdxT [Thermococcus kodakarensis]Q5JFR2.1 RecName: Full=Pyridoxal 5'-phosphate synthase subunit PdxT; AltName: Full=Pdx2; AltName: Full=Pyridoxal 5'-phosphate synthase glutaminase subunit [Thermococcus kodakarensis KOD1]WCN28306.1 pyridoxal 5'-phosphate synthase glutaminase subunit PdxT [Thermococcus kodakarensis]WCN30601.1 pyridoxal 5'-phosphate synthase glutaminase subunit PdxT [Thermococcus kodakarensis]BAD84405.1 pyridoxine biosynthesis 